MATGSISSGKWLASDDIGSKSWESTGNDIMTIVNKESWLW